MSAPDLTGFSRALLAIDAEPERILEVCCGAGEATLFLAREFPRARVRGLDASAQAVRAATARTGLDPEGRVAFKTGSPGRLPYPGDHFDLVVQRHGRLHPAELARVMRPRGRLVAPAAARARGPLGVGRPALGALRRQGFEIESGSASDPAGEFLVMRLAGGGAGGARD